jgi:hypothetical protein
MTERWLTELRKVNWVEPSPDVLERVERGPLLPEEGPRPRARVAIVLFAVLVAVAGSWGVFAAFSTRDADRRASAEGSDAFTALWPETSLAEAQQIQERVDAGDSRVQWRTDAGNVALQYAQDVLGWSDPIAAAAGTDDADKVIVSVHGPNASCQEAECQVESQAIVTATLERLVRSGEGGVWSVTAVSNGG